MKKQVVDTATREICSSTFFWIDAPTSLAAGQELSTGFRLGSAQETGSEGTRFCWILQFDDGGVVSVGGAKNGIDGIRIVEIAEDDDDTALLAGGSHHVEGFSESSLFIGICLAQYIHRLAQDTSRETRSGSYRSRPATEKPYGAHPSLGHGSESCRQPHR